MRLIIISQNKLNILIAIFCQVVKFARYKIIATIYMLTKPTELFIENIVNQQYIHYTYTLISYYFIYTCVDTHSNMIQL